jgi:thiol-disulfide isomerase/thioredoxin
MKRILFLLVLVILFSACKEKVRFTVKGVVKGNKRDYIYLTRLEVDTPVLLDSSKINRNGQFSFKVKAEEPDFYQVGYSTSDFITLLARPGEKIQLTFEGEYLYENYKVDGSEESVKLQALDADLAETHKKLDSLSTLYEKASTSPDSITRRTELESQFSSVIKDQRKKNIAFIITNLNSLASIKALYQKINPETYVLYDSKDLQYMKIVNDTLSKYYPHSKHVQALSRDFTKEMNQMYASKLEQMASNLPETKLDPNLKTTEGKRIALSSLRGKYVLLAFWSVRSKQCIEENLQLKDLYKRYKSKGFEIYQINLDENEVDWRTAVNFDELPWINTREDDPEELLNARLFNIKAVPANYLFDRGGKIIASNLHGKALEIKLAQLFN